ncbi:MAG: hypothetical protein IJ174_08885 [Clostridia bacterium]|nr:hypothetical protein [Clostridia bacterium]
MTENILKEQNEEEQQLPVCPFYLGEDERAILCEGLAAGSRSVQLFGSRGKKEEWLRSVCANTRCDKLCPITCMQAYLYDEQKIEPEPCLRRYTKLEIRTRRKLTHRRRTPCPR